MLLLLSVCPPRARTKPWCVAVALLLASCATLYVNVVRTLSLANAGGYNANSEGEGGRWRTALAAFAVPEEEEGGGGSPPQFLRPSLFQAAEGGDGAAPLQTDPAAAAAATTTTVTVAASSSMPSVFSSSNNNNMDEFLQQHRADLRRSNITTPWPNRTTTYSYAKRKLIAGYRNQIMALTMLMLHANDEGHGQFLLESLHHKDTYGTDLFVPFEFYFDVEHWNTHYNDTEVEMAVAAAAEAAGAGSDNTTTGQGRPAQQRQRQRRRHPWSLPRLVHYDPELHGQWDVARGGFGDDVIRNGHPATRPYGYSKGSTRLAAAYQRYVRGAGRYASAVEDGTADGVTADGTAADGGGTRRNPAEVMMLQGALRPHPALQAILDGLLSSQLRDDKGNSRPYMTLHARVEPDMQRHPVCMEKKVFLLSDVVRMVEKHFPTPPFGIGAVFLPINRQYLEREGTVMEGGNATAVVAATSGNTEDGTTTATATAGGTTNWVAVDNLHELDRLSRDGMWNGTVPVVEFGANALKGTVYDERPSTAGAILNYFLGIDAAVFVGTEVSSFSHDLLAARFYRGRRSVGANYRYLPSGLEEWVTPETVDPPGHLC